MDKARCIPLSRRQFWEVFTDFEVVCGREWLSLPLDHFYLFQDHADDETVDAVEVLMVLALFCRADPEDALTFCFDVFDGDGSKIMELVRGDVWRALLADTARAAYGCGGVPCGGCGGIRTRCNTSYGC